MWIPPVFEQEDSLPCPQRHAPSDDGNDLARPRQYHPDVAWHVVRTFLRVYEPRSVLGHEFVEKHFHVPPCAGVCVFHDDQARAGMLHEYGDSAVSDAGP